MLFNRLNLTHNPRDSHGDSVEYSTQANTVSKRRRSRPRPVMSNMMHEPISIDVNLATKRDFRYSPHFPSPMHHLKGKERLYYTEVPLLEDMTLFQVGLELFNRKGVRPMMKKNTRSDDETSEICQYFFESAGKAKVTPKLCTECQDIQKNRKRYDYY